MLAFTSVYFSESRLFNGLRSIQIKNFSPPCLRLCTTCAPPPRGSSSMPNFTRADGDCHSMNSEFLQEMPDSVMAVNDPADRRPGKEESRFIHGATWRRSRTD